MIIIWEQSEAEPCPEDPVQTCWEGGGEGVTVGTTVSGCRTASHTKPLRGYGDVVKQNGNQEKHHKKSIPSLC